MGATGNDGARARGGREHVRDPGADPDWAAKDAICAASPLARLTGPARSRAIAIGTLELLGKGRILVASGEGPRALFLLRSGRVRVERARGGNADQPFPLGHRGPGDWVGESGFGNTNPSETAIVVDAAQALRIPFPALRHLLDEEGRAREVVAAALVEAGRAAQQRLETLLIYCIEVRLARFVLDALVHWGAPHEGGRVVDAAFTHAEIATAIGSTRETVTLLIGKLRRAGVLAVARRRLVVRDHAELVRYAALSESTAAR